MQLEIIDRQWERVEDFLQLKEALSHTIFLVKRDHLVQPFEEVGEFL